MKEEVAKREIESLDYYLQNHTDDYSEESHTAMMMAIDALSSKWIPVSERLPEDSGEYLATIYDTDENYKYMDIAELEDGIWQYKDYIKVLAWMPLPKPYEPQERSDKEMSKEKQIQDYERKKLIDEISKMPPMVIATAYLYALNYTLYGEDVTKAWTTAVQHHAVLSKARERGYYEALSHSNIGKDVLDKLRAELHATAELHDDGDYYLRDEWIDEYFDKYKPMVEPQERSDKDV